MLLNTLQNIYLLLGEELTFFGFEVAKVRKFMYGFLPAGTFRTLNKFSSTLQFVEEFGRKSLKDGSEVLGKEIEKLQEQLGQFTKGSAGYELILEKLNLRLSELEDGDLKSKFTDDFGKPIEKAKELKLALADGFIVPDKNLISYSKALVTNMGKLVKNTSKLGIKKFPT